MKKLFIITLLLFSFSLYSQQFGLGLGGNIPAASDFKKSVDFGYNFGLWFHLPVGPFTGTLYGGYGLWSEKSFQDGDAKTELDLQNFPVILAGLRKDLAGSFYVSGMAGIYPAKFKVTVTQGDAKEEQEAKETQAALYPAAGYIFPMAPFDLDISAGYLWTQDFSQVLLQAAILF